MKRKVEKHMPYFNLLEGFRSAKGCALCELDERDDRLYLAAVLREFVNDVGVRADLVRSKGYCARHASLLVEFRDALGTAILCEDQLAAALDFLKHAQHPVARLSRSGKLGSSWAKHEMCPACRVARERQRVHLDTLIRSVDDPEMRRAIEESPGLCFPHLLAALDSSKDPHVLDVLIDLHVRKLSGLRAELRELIRKHDYRFWNEGFGPERDSWIRAVRMLTGGKAPR